MIIDVIVDRSPLPSFSKAEISFDGIQPAFELLRADLKRWEESTVVSRQSKNWAQTINVNVSRVCRSFWRTPSPSASAYFSRQSEVRTANQKGRSQISM
jgi:hypothetical protein